MVRGEPTEAKSIGLDESLNKIKTAFDKGDSVKVYKLLEKHQKKFHFDADAISVRTNAGKNDKQYTMRQAESLLNKYHMGPEMDYYKSRQARGTTGDLSKYFGKSAREIKNDPDSMYDLTTRLKNRIMSMAHDKGLINITNKPLEGLELKELNNIAMDLTEKKCLESYNMSGGFPGYVKFVKDKQYRR